MAFVKTYSAPPICKNEILRYAGCKQESDLPLGIIENCLNEARDMLTYKVCYLLLDINTFGDNCNFGAFSVKSKMLADNLNGCNKAVVFAATVGIGIDRIISKYSAVSPSKAVLFQAIGAERIEALCNTFCNDICDKTGLYARPRFSPGYGDFDLSVQKDLFSVLNCQKLIGLTLTDSMLMSPTKSVTAIMGLSEKPQGKSYNKCKACENTDCAYRGEL